MVSQTEQHILCNVSALPLALQYGITPPLALLPDTAWWTNQVVAPLQQASKAERETFGISEEFEGDHLFLRWLRPLAWRDAKLAFAHLNEA
eukprot:9040803-Karenia_brevis.AAC.1